MILLFWYNFFLQKYKLLKLVVDAITFSLTLKPIDSVGKESDCNAGVTDSIPGSGRSPGGGNGNPLQYSCLGNPMERGDWRAPVHSVAELDMTKVTENAYTTSNKIEFDFPYSQMRVMT